MSEARKFYFVRHGETEANRTNLAAGAGWDVELNEAGLAQAAELAQSPLFEVCSDVATICVSPLQRALKTAETLNQKLKANVVTVADLREWELGEWEQKSWSDLPNLFLPDSNPPGGETQMEFGLRVSGGLQQALANPGPVLIVAHGGVWYAIAKILQLKHSDIANCQLKQVTRENKDAPWILV